MPTVLEQALEELKAMPAEAQDAITRDLLDIVRSERKWDQLFADPRSDALFDRIAKKSDPILLRWIGTHTEYDRLLR